MDQTAWVLLAIFIISFAVLIGFFVTKTKGFGQYSTSTLLLALVVTISSLLYTAGKLDEHILVNILFAVIGFAAGLFSKKDS